MKVKVSLLKLAVATLAAALTFHLNPAVSESATLVKYNGPSFCEVSVYKSSDPITFKTHTLRLIPPTDDQGNPVPYPDGQTAVNVLYNDSPHTISCNGQVHVDTPYPEMPMAYSCTITSSRTTVLFSLFRVYDLNVYDYPYSSPPSASDPQLNDTSEASPFCLTDDVNQAEACKWEKQNLEDPLLTERGIPLNNWVVYTRTEVNSLRLGYDLDLDTSPFNPGDIFCAYDENNDHDISQSEIDYCLATDVENKYLCPFQLANCYSGHLDPICPDPGTFNPDSNKCETPWYCTGTDYHLYGDVCYSYSHIACVSPGSYSSSYHVCLASSWCPSGYSYSYADCICYTQDYSCPPGTYNSSKCRCEATPTGQDHNCPNGFSYNEGDDVCVRSVSCGTPGAFNCDTQRCEASVRCPSGYTFNCDRHSCQRTPYCNDGSTFNTTTYRCEKPPVCPSGYTKAETNCQADRSCDCYTTFNPSTHR